jgi:type III pantothenate kinase
VNLVIDIGNTAVKAALFEITNCELRVTRIAPETLLENLPQKVDRAIVVSTRVGETELERVVREALEERAGRFVKLDHSTPVPLKNLYGTPETLGYDRLAAAVGAAAMFPGKAVLVVDFGTAITFDVVTAAGEFLGGNISPGAALRFRALHEGTGALPSGSLPEEVEFPARTTKAAIESGVVRGIIAETEHYIEAAREKFGDIEIIFTGGDAEYFAERVKIPTFNFASLILDRLRLGKLQTSLRFRSPYTIFAVSDLVFQGLNAILEHNANR